MASTPRPWRKGSSCNKLSKNECPRLFKSVSLTKVSSLKAFEQCWIFYLWLDLFWYKQIKCIYKPNDRCQNLNSHKQHRLPVSMESYSTTHFLCLKKNIAWRIEGCTGGKGLNRAILKLIPNDWTAIFIWINKTANNYLLYKNICQRF